MSGRVAPGEMSKALSLYPVCQSGRRCDVVESQRGGSVQRSVLAVLGVAYRRWGVLSESHQSVGVRIFEDNRRGRAQLRRDTTQSDNLGIM
jgi:hypothetical protein